MPLIMLPLPFRTDGNDLFPGSGGAEGRTTLSPTNGSLAPSPMLDKLAGGGVDDRGPPLPPPDEIQVSRSGVPRSFARHARTVVGG